MVYENIAAVQLLVFTFAEEFRKSHLAMFRWACNTISLSRRIFTPRPKSLTIRVIYSIIFNQIPHWVLGLALVQYTIQFMQILININSKILVKSRKYFQIIKACPINHCVMTVCPTNFDWRRKMQKISFLYCESTRVV